VTVATVAGELDLATVPQLEQALEGPLRDAGRLVVDLSECSFIDSSGLRALVGARAASEAAGGSFALVTSGAELIRILAVAGLDSVFEIHEERRAALVPR
jgi:anti-anti-sigma factor